MTRRLLLLAAVVTLGAGSVWAHHSFAAFDVDSQKTVTGTVSKVDWTNPHTWIWVDVVDADGGVDTWGFEGMSPNYLARRGWKRTTLVPGDTITVTFRPLKNGENGGMFMRGERPDGLVLTMGGAQTQP
jgi:hypothetical protein